MWSPPSSPNHIIRISLNDTSDQTHSITGLFQCQVIVIVGNGRKIFSYFVVIRHLWLSTWTEICKRWLYAVVHDLYKWRHLSSCTSFPAKMKLIFVTLKSYPTYINLINIWVERPLLYPGIGGGDWCLRGYLNTHRHISTRISGLTPLDRTSSVYHWSLDKDSSTSRVALWIRLVLSV